MTSRPTPRPAPPGTPAIGQALRELFTRDQQLSEALNEALNRHRAALGELTTGLSADALRGIYGPAGPDLGLSGRKPAVLLADSPTTALEAVADDARRALSDYMHTSEERRELAIAVGELTTQLATALTAAGITDVDAHQVDVDQLAAGHLHASPAQTP